MELSPEVTSAIITFFGTALLAIIGFNIRTHIGNKVILRKLRETSLVKISPLVSENLSFAYKNKPIEKLKLYELELTNEGYIDIDNFEVNLDITLKDSNGIVEVQSIDPQGKIKVIDLLEFGNYIIQRPFLNMLKKYKDEKISIQIFTNTELTIKVTGGGKGWGVVYKDTNPTLLYSYFNAISMGMAIGLTFIFFSMEKNPLLLLVFMSIIIILVVHSAVFRNFFNRRNRF